MDYHYLGDYHDQNGIKQHAYDMMLFMNFRALSFAAFLLFLPSLPAHAAPEDFAIDPDDLFATQRQQHLEQSQENHEKWAEDYASRAYQREARQRVWANQQENQLADMQESRQGWNEAAAEFLNASQERQATWDEQQADYQDGWKSRRLRYLGESE